MISLVVLHYSLNEEMDEMLKKTLDSFTGMYDELILLDEKTDFLTHKLNKGLKTAKGDYVIFTGNDNPLKWGALKDLCIPNTVTTASVNSIPDLVVMTMTCIPRTVLDKVGYFDEQFQVYCGDEDYLLRLKENNIEVKCMNNVIVSHPVGGRTSDKLGYSHINAKDNFIFKQKWNIKSQ